MLRAVDACRLDDPRRPPPTACEPDPIPGRTALTGRSGTAGATLIGAVLSVQTVKANCAAGHDAMFRLRRGSFEAVQHHLRRAREEAVGVRVVGRPQDLMRADV